MNGTEPNELLGVGRTMFKIDPRLACISLTLLTPMALDAETLDRVLQPGLSLTEIRAESLQPAGRPILVTLVVTNTADKPIALHFLLGGRPSVSLDGVDVRVTDAQGKVREAALENSSHQGGSGGFRQLPPGQSEDAPAIVPPMPAGTYTLQIGGKKVKVSVKDDAQQARKRAEELLEKLRRGDDMFAQFVFRKYPDQAITGVLVKDLLSDNSQAVARSAHVLSLLRKLPKDAGAIVHKAMKKQLEMIGQQQNRDAGVLSSLSNLASTVGTDEALAAVLDLARSDLAGGTRASAMSALAPFKQAAAVQELHAFLKDPDEDTRFCAARALAKRQDTAALPVLVEVARDTQSQWRQYAYQELAHYSNNPEAEAVLKEGDQAVGRASFASWWTGLGGPGDLLLQTPGVPEELKLTTEQIKKITEIVQRCMSDYRDRLSQMGGGAPSGKVRALQEEVHEQTQKALRRVLTPEQEKRLWQINLQAQRTEALVLPEVQEKIKFGVEQQQNIKEIMENWRQERNEIMQGPQGYPEETRKKLDAVAKESTERIMAVLTEAQKRTFREMTGKPFDFQAHRQKISKGAGAARP
jgi:hypothetical protein